MSVLAARLPEFPWDRLAPHAAVARSHPEGVVDLSVGTPVDDVAPRVQAALASAANAPGYPLTHGTPAFREAVVRWTSRRLGSILDDADAVLPTIGSKELVGLLPLLLGLGPGDIVVIPTIAYPTYAVGAQVVGAQVVACDDPDEWPAGTRLVWLNSPSNPTGAVADIGLLRRAVARARDLGAVLASDECYIELGFDVEPVSVLHRDVIGSDATGVLGVYSMSKRSNLAGYRAAFLTGDRPLVASLLEARKHLGLMVPSPVLVAATAALDDDAHVTAQHERYARRRAVLRPALEAAGLRIEHSVAGLYLWATRDEECWATVSWLADRGILVAPGDFYGGASGRFVRVALTASDERIHAAAARLAPMA